MFDAIDGVCGLRFMVRNLVSRWVAGYARNLPMVAGTRTRGQPRGQSSSGGVLGNVW